MKLIINNLDVSRYIQQSGFSESAEKVYDTSNQFTAADGTERKLCIGVRKSYSVSLGNVPQNVKNQLRTRSGYSSVSCTIGDKSATYSLNDFNAQPIIQNEQLNLWSVKFTLVSSSVTKSTSGYGIYSVTCGGSLFSMEDNTIVGDIKISHSTGGFPSSGICASQLSFSIDLDKFGGVTPYFDPSATCTVGGFDAPTYYVSGRSLNGNAYTITATDRTIFLDLPFDYTTLAELAEKEKDANGNEISIVATSSVLNEIARQAGFSSAGGSIVVDKIPMTDLATTCRSILDALAQASCGVWYCSADDSLQFYAFGKETCTGTLSLTENNRTDIQKNFSKGPISGVLMINNSTSGASEERFTQGGVGSYNCIKITSKYATAARCRAIYDRVVGGSYTAFSIAHCMCSHFITIGTLFYGDDANYYPIGRVAISLSYTGAYAAIGADLSSENEWDYTGALTREVKKRIEEGRKYNGLSITQEEGLTCEGAGGKITMADGTITFWCSSEPKVNEG